MEQPEVAQTSDNTSIVTSVPSREAKNKTGVPTPKLGRKRDHTRDQDILDAAIEVLAETGYERMTIDMVASRAKAGKATLYRRWTSKGELVVDAVACMKKGDLSLDTLPDTGTLRGDLVAMIKPRTLEEAEHKLRVMAGLMSMLSTSPELADTVHAEMIEPRVAVNRLFLRRAIARGEISANTDVDMLATALQAMATYRTMILRKPMSTEFLVSVIDGMLLPAVGLGSTPTTMKGAPAPA